MATANKYDRQLRLWGASGQKSLSESCVILINATAVGTETLKNLVLPGIGSFVIVDDQEVEPSSSPTTPFSNFFVFDHSSYEKDTIAKPKSRAEVAAMHLSELNPDVRGNHKCVTSLFSTDYASLLTSIRNEHGGNLLVIAADLPPPIIRNIASTCWGDSNLRKSDNIPLLIVKSYGLIGSVRVQVAHHPIIESKPDNTKPDLRLSMPRETFPELHALADLTNLDTLDSKDHGHVPYVILLLKALDKWRTINPTVLLPKTMDEKKHFKTLIRDMARDYDMELNFQEACENDYLAYSGKEIPWDVQVLLDKAGEDYQRRLEKIHNANSTTDGSSISVEIPLGVTSFDLLLLALHKFLKANDGLPPLNGSIPDMTSATQPYVRLQNVYKERAERDKNNMRTILDDITKEYASIGVPLPPSISDEELSTFCKNVYNLQLLQTRSYNDECTYSYSNEEEKEDIQGELIAATYDPYETLEHTPILWYIALSACDDFYDEYGHYPGQDSPALALESDANAVQRFIENIVSKMGLGDNTFIKSMLLPCNGSSDNIEEDDSKNLAFAKEIVRYHNAEIHNIASVIGGVASQEAVKLITRQYVPINNTYIFNGIAGVAAVYKF